MKNGIIAGAIILAGIGGVALLSDDSSTKNNTSNIERSIADKNCDDFSSKKEAQEFFEAQGGPSNDPHGLDRDKDGRVCESLK